MESVRFPSGGGLSVRSIFTFVLAVVATALLWVTFFSSPSVHAAEARWGGDAIIFDQHGFVLDEGFQDTTGTIPEDSSVYRSPIQGTGSSQKALIIYFSPGVDPPTATSANYVEFDYDNGVVSNPQSQQQLDLTLKSEQSAQSSCSVSGIGWLICPMSNFLADAMDTVFDILAGMIETQPPILGDSSNSLYQAWNVMRTIANVAFVIVFLIIIYSQLTSLGVSNYGLKRLTPRLIIAAILVNVSFYISALAIDVSNILGYSIQEIFVNIREGLFYMTDDTLDSEFLANNWTAVVTAAIGGGGLVVGGTYFLATGGIHFLLPLLIGLILTLIFVVLILAARQAIIVILVIIAPLAFVANLLPNTEKLFDKWKDLFMTMLVFFPAFSLVFGGSQLAGQLIIQNANGNFITLVFGLAVQIAPLVITPLLLKLSGGLLGRIAQIANNPRKGLLDRSRNAAKARADYARQNNIEKGARFRNPTSWGAGMVRKNDFRKRRLADKTEAAKQGATNRYNQTSGYEKIHERAHEAQVDHEKIENTHKAHLAKKASVRGSTLNVKTIELEDAKVAAEKAAAQNAHMISAYRAGAYNVMNNEKLEQMQKRIAHNVIETAAWKQGEENHKPIMQRNIANALREKVDTDPAYAETQRLLNIAAGHGDAEMRSIGRDNAQASAVATLSKLNRDARENAVTLIQTQAVELGRSLPAHIGAMFKEANRPGTHVTQTQLEATLEIAASEGLVGIFEDARGSTSIDQSMLDAVVSRHVSDLKAKGGFHIQQAPDLSLQRYIDSIGTDQAKGATIEEATEAFHRDMAVARLRTLGSTPASNLGSVKFGTFASLSKDIGQLMDQTRTSIELDQQKLARTTDAGERAKLSEQIEQKQEIFGQVFNTLDQGLSDSSTRSTMTDRLKMANNIRRSVGTSLGLEDLEDDK